MNRLSNFGDFALTRAEMKRVNGGECHIWGYYNNQYVVDVRPMSKSKAMSKSASLVQKYGAGFGWCCDSGC